MRGHGEMGNNVGGFETKAVRENVMDRRRRSDVGYKKMFPHLKSVVCYSIYKKKHYHGFADIVSSFGAIKMICVQSDLCTK